MAAPIPTKPAGAIKPSPIRVVDGDTIRVGSTDQSVRLAGFNTPETWKPACNRELQLGTTATNRLKALLQTAEYAEVDFIRCA